MNNVRGFFTISNCRQPLNVIINSNQEIQKERTFEAIKIVFCKALF